MIKKIPLANKMKRQTHRDIALAQDLIVLGVYRFFSNAVLHGGTSIWRCYNGERFSEDLDFYLFRDLRAINLFFDYLLGESFTIKKKKLSERSIYSELLYGRTSVRFEATFQKIKGVLLDYEKIDGNFISIYGLSAESLIKEKCVTYLKRKKIRDLYDVFFLLRFLRNVKEIREVYDLIKNYSKPVDEENLQTIIIQGIVPSSEGMMEYIKRKWENPNI